MFRLGILPTLLTFGLASCATATNPSTETDAAGLAPGPDAKPTGLADAGKSDASRGEDPDANQTGKPDANQVLGPDARVENACAQALQSLRFDFETGPQGFTHDRMPEVANSQLQYTFDHWELGPANVSCASGQNCWGTNLDGNYAQCQRGYLRSPPMNLSACAGQDVVLLFEHNYNFWTQINGSVTSYDGGIVEVSNDGIAWQTADLDTAGTVSLNPFVGNTICIESDNFYVNDKRGFVGSSNGWVSARVTIPASMIDRAVYIRFAYSSGVSSDTRDEEESMRNTAPGWYIDNLRFQQ